MVDAAPVFRFLDLFRGPEGKIIVRQLPKDGSLSLAINANDNPDVYKNIFSELWKYPNTYFSPALFHSQSVGYSELEVVGTHVVWVDVDPAANERSGLAANGVVDVDKVKAKLVEFGHQPSAIVFSGHGCHVYWRLNSFLPRQQIKPVLRALIERLKTVGIESDVACTNANRILRLPGTVNMKPGRDPAICELHHMAPAARVAVEDLIGRPVPTVDVSQSLPSLEELVRGTDISNSEVQISIDKVAQFCGAIREAIETGGRDHNYNQWVACLSVAHRDPDPWAAAKAVSKDHPTYTDEQLLAKMRNGPKRWAYSCRAFELAWQSNPKTTSIPCHTCPAKHLASSPIAVALAELSWDPFDFGALASAVINAQDNVCASEWTEIPTQIGKAYFMIDSAKDQIVVVGTNPNNNTKPKPKEVEPGEAEKSSADKKENDVAPENGNGSGKGFKLRHGPTATNIVTTRAFTHVRQTYRQGMARFNNMELPCAELHYQVMTRNGDVVDLEPPDRLSNDAYYLDLGMVPSNKSYFYDFKAMAEAKARQSAIANSSHRFKSIVSTRLFGPAGWYPSFDDNGYETEGNIFTINQTIFRRRRQPLLHVQSPGNRHSALGHSIYSGDLEAQRYAAALVVKRLLPELQLPVAASLGLIPSQLVAPSGRPAAIFISSAQGGIGKTLMCTLVSGLFGRPTVLTSLTNAAIRRLLSQRNLQPFLIDEATSDIDDNLNANDTRGLRVLQVLKDVVNGTGHLVATRSDNVGVYEHGNWIVQFITTANHSIRQLHEGRIARDPTIADRFLDLEISSEDAARAQEWFRDTKGIKLHAINENYGYLGAELIQYAVDHQDSIRARDPSELLDRIPDPEVRQYLDNASGRFFTHLVISVVLGLELARSVLHIPMDDDAVLAVLARAIREGRDAFAPDRRLKMLLSALERCRIDGMRPVRVVDAARNGAIVRAYSGRSDNPPAVVQVIDSSLPGSPVVETRYDLTELKVEHSRPTLMQELLRLSSVSDLGTTWLDPYNQDVAEHRIISVRRTP